MDVVEKIGRENWEKTVKMFEFLKVRKNSKYKMIDDALDTIKRYLLSTIDYTWYAKPYKFERDEEHILYLLELELSKLHQMGFTNKTEVSRIKKMIRNEGMRDLGKALINNMRDKRIKKYGRYK